MKIVKLIIAAATLYMVIKLFISGEWTQTEGYALAAILIIGLIADAFLFINKNRS